MLLDLLVEFTDALASYPGDIGHPFLGPVLIGAGAVLILIDQVIDLMRIGLEIKQGMPALGGPHELPPFELEADQPS